MTTAAARRPARPFEFVLRLRTAACTVTSEDGDAYDRVQYTTGWRFWLLDLLTSLSLDQRA